MTLTGAGLNFQVSLIVFKLDGVETLLQACDTYRCWFEFSGVTDSV